MNSKQILAFITASLLGGQASAFWRMECRGVSGQARLDPLVDEGVVGSHVHEIFGSGGKFTARLLTVWSDTANDLLRSLRRDR